MQARASALYRARRGVWTVYLEPDEADADRLILAAQPIRDTPRGQCKKRRTELWTSVRLRLRDVPQRVHTP